MRVRTLVSAVLSSPNRTAHAVTLTALAATVGALTPVVVGASSASADPSSDAVSTVVSVALAAPASVTRGGSSTLTAKVAIADAPVPGQSVQFVTRPVGAATWQVLGSATTGADGTTTYPVKTLDSPSEFGAYYAAGQGTEVHSNTVTTVVHVIDLVPAAPRAVAYNKRVTIGGHLLKDGAEGLASQRVQVRFRTSPHGAWGAPRWATTNARGVASVAAKFPRTFQVGIRFPGSGSLAPSPFKVTTVRVGPKPAIAPSGFRFPLLDPSRATSPSTWTYDQGIDLFAIGQACGAAAKLVAVGDGTVIQTGISGFGPTAPVLRMSSGPFKGRNVYYGHTGRIYVHVGQHVKAGDLVAEIGCGRVGMSSAPHLEIGVGVAGGPPCCPGWHQTSSQMMAQLVASLRAR